ncbi:phage tail tape measure protein [Leptolyngbya ohadii]|uniref:phage tail tape measure protein n=1 Tax=Leptolyngbya ohadii TaxID=1962290 RepID=UPI000B599083|nr:phage tail tape measure protein [Leptolyngbya ohadii]
MASQALQILLEAIDNASAPIRGVIEQIDRLERTSRSISDAGKKISDFGGAMTRNVTLPVAAGLGAATYAAIQMEDALTQVNKAYGFDAGSKQAQQAQQVIQGLSLELGQMPTDVAAIATEAGKLGVQFNQLNDYTRLVTKSSVAFDMSAQNAGESMGVLTNVLGYMKNGVVDIEGLTRFGDVVNHLADNGATSESAIINVMKRAGGATRAFGLTSESAAGMAAAFLNLGDAPEVVGTAMNSMLPALMNASRGTDKFQKGLEALGLDAKTFEQSIKKDAAGALTDFISRLGKSENASAVLSDMFGTGSDASMLLKAAKNAEQFRKTIESASKVKAGGMMSTFDKQSATTSAALTRFGAVSQILGNTIGSALLPPLNDVLEKITPMVQKFAEFAQANPKIMQMVVSFALVAAAIGPVIIVVGQLVTALGSLKAAMVAIKGVQLASSFSGLGMAANSILAVGKAMAVMVAAAAALGAILGGVVYAVFSVGAALTGESFTFGEFINVIKTSLMELPQNLAMIPETVGAIFSAIGVSIQTTFINLGLSVQMMVTNVMNGFNSLGAQIGAVWNQIVASVQTAFSNMVSAISNGVSQAVTAVQSMGSQIIGAVQSIGQQLYSAGANLMQMLADGIRSAAGAVTGAISSIAGQVAGFLPGSPVDTGPLRVFNSGYTGSQLMQMLAGGIQSYPIDGVMGAALSPVAAQTAGIVPTSTGAGITPTGAMGGGMGGGAITLTYSPTLYLGNAGKESEGSFRELLQEHRDDIERMLDEMQRRKERLAYG